MIFIRFAASVCLIAAATSVSALNYHTRNDGNWNGATVWRTGGTLCTATGATNTATPPDANDTVYICNTHRVVLNISTTVQAIEIRNGGELDNDGNARTLTLGGATPAGTGTTLFVLDNGGIFDPGTFISVVMNPNQGVAPAATTLTGGTGAGIAFYNLTLNPAVTAARIYNFGAAPITINGAFNITPSGNNSLTVNMGAAITTGAASLTTIQRSGGTAAPILTTTASNHAFSSGRITVGNGGTLTANDSTVTLTSTAGPLFTLSGTGAFTAGGSNVVMNPNANVTLTSGAITFNDLTLTPTITTGRTYTFGTGAAVGRDLTINPTKVTAGTAILDLVLASALTVGRVTTITGTTNGRGRLDPTATDFALTSGYLDIAVNGTHLPRDSTVTLNGDSIPANCPGGVCPALFTLAGTFTQAGSTVQMQSDGAATLTSGAVTFNNLTINPTITAARTQTFGPDAINVSNDFIVNPSKVTAGAATLTVNMGASITLPATETITIQGSGNATGLLSTVSNHALNSGRISILDGGSFSANASTVTLNAITLVLFTRTGTGIFTPGTSRVVMNPNATLNTAANRLTNGTITFWDLELTPTMTTDRTYTFGAGAITCDGNFIVRPTSDDSGDVLTVNMAAAITVLGDTTIQGLGTGPGNANLSTTATDFAFSSGRLFIQTAGTFTANDSIVTLTGATGPLVTRVGTFTPGGSTVVLAPTASVALNSGTITFNRLRANMPGLTATLGNDITISGTLADALDFDFDNSGSGDGYIATGTNTLILNGPTVLVSGAGTGGHVIGNVQRAFTNTSAATRTFTFPIGDGMNYAPVLVVFNAGMTAGNLTATTFAPGADHPQTVAGGTPAEPNKSVNRYWTLKNATAAGTADVTFNYQPASPADLDSGVTVGSFRVGRGATCTGTGSGRQCLTWTAPTLLGTPTATQAGLNDLAISNLPTSEFDYVVGEARRVSREKEFIYTRETY
jgi:hypothetical protein